MATLEILVRSRIHPKNRAQLVYLIELQLEIAGVRHPIPLGEVGLASARSLLVELWGSREVAAASRRRIDALRARLTPSGIDLIHVDAATSVVDPLVRFFKARERRLRR